jgi:SWI/SNF-related matrix-associated actin-dependent regulator of chromatin subfamily A3
MGITKQQKQRETHVMQVKWLRIVLDEGHFVKNSNTQQSRAVAALAARSRWIVSGTPIQNSMKDLFGLVSFLHLQPLCERPVFRSSFERPMAIGDNAALVRLKILMAAVAMRRLKTTEVNGQPLVQLPAKSIEFVDVELPEGQRALYDRWEQAGRDAVSSHIENGTLFRNYSSVLEIILRCERLPELLDGC